MFGAESSVNRKIKMLSWLAPFYLVLDLSKGRRTSDDGTDGEEDDEGHGSDTGSGTCLQLK